MGALVWIALVLFILWLLGLVAFKTAGFAIHIILIVAVIMLIIGLFRRSTP
ncbi:MAG TPA: lmo0937 family membrane protein [Longimicrobiales bacterium]|nr:lmo0937 family membrane protein [Longimicrobiales bacterium]